MKKLSIYFTILAVTFSACNRDEIFTREQYKAVVALKSEGSFNTYPQRHDLAKIDANGFSDGFISANVGGALDTEQPINLTIIEDADLFHSYNDNNYGTESFRYARYLSPDRYSIPNRSIIIPAGERNGRMAIKIRPVGLSPDSIYLIPFRVEKCSAYELNLKKSTVLYRIYLKNFWSNTQSISSYAHRGNKFTGTSEVGSPSFMSKSVYPVSGNEIRFFAGDKVYNAKENQEKAIAQWSIRVAVNNISEIESGSAASVSISAWDNSTNGIKVTQVDDDKDYPNTFQLVDDGYGKIYKTFLLCYDYKDPSSEVNYRMKEELKIEYVKEVK